MNDDTVIIFGSQQAHALLQANKESQLLYELEEALNRAIDIASELSMSGKSFARMVLDGCTSIDFDMTGFIGEIFDYGSESGRMPDEYYSLISFRSAVEDALEDFKLEPNNE